MIWVDIAIVALLAIYAISGLLRGFNQEMFYLLVWMLGIAVACCFSNDFAIAFGKISSSSMIRLVASFTTLLTITLVLGWLINLLLAEALHSSRVTFMDRLGGLFLGALHGCVVAFALVLIAGITPLPKERWWHEAKYLPPFQSFAVLVKAKLPSKLASSINYPKPVIAG